MINYILCKGQLKVLIMITTIVALLATACGAGATTTPLPSTPTSTITPSLDDMDMEEPTPTHEAMDVEELTPTPTHEAMDMEELTPTPETENGEPTPTPNAARTPTPTFGAPGELIQEFAVIENYAADRFFPGWIVVLKDVPVRMYLTRLHREHINRFTIVPFLDSSDVILPGEVGVMEFVPDQVGEFKILNVGHGGEATLVVVETEEEAKERIAERGIQMYALIHSIDDFRMFPDKLVAQSGIPVTIHNISLIDEHMVSVEPLYDPEDINVRPRERTIFEFTPDNTGEFTILHELHGFTGQLSVVE